MNTTKRMRITSLFLTFSLITTFTLLIQAKFVHAEEMDIVPTGGIDIDNFILAGQNVSMTSSQSTPTDTTILGVTSLFNKSLTATLSRTTSGGSGFWWIFLMGTGGRNWADFAYGLIGPGGQTTASVDIDDGLSFGLAIGSTNVTSEVSSENPFKYSIQISGTSAE